MITDEKKQKFNGFLRNSVLLLGIFFVFFFIFNQKEAQAINLQITFQGKLTDSSGNVVTNGTYYLKLTIYDASSTSGSCQYTASSTCASVTSTPVSVSNGLFSINLGDTSASLASISSSLFNNSELYLGITVCSGPGTGCDSEMTPRKRLTASPYAFNSDYLGGVTTSTSGGNGSYIPATDSSGNLKISNSVYISTSTSGQFGIGTSTVPSGYKTFIDSTTASDKLLVIRANASQTGSLQEWQNNSGKALTFLDTSGNLYIGDGSTSSTLQKNLLKVAYSSSDPLGKFYVDSSGNVSASGTLATFGNTTLGNSDAADGDATRVYGSLSLGASGNGYSQLFLQSTSTSAMPLVIRANVTQSDTAYLTAWEDSAGNVFATMASTTQSGSNAYVEFTLGEESGKAGMIKVKSAGGFSNLFGNQLSVGNGTGYSNGVFNVNPSGNVSASGTLQSFGNTTLGDSDSAGGDTTRIYGTLAIGAVPTGNAQVYLSASSTTAVPLVIRGSTGGAGTSYDYLTQWQDSSGNTIASLSTSSLGSLTMPWYNPAGVLSIIDDASLTVGSNSRSGFLDIKGSGSILLRDVSGNIITFLGPNDFEMGNALGTVTSTYSNTNLKLFMTSGYNLGTFYLDSSGNISASGTLSINLDATPSLNFSQQAKVIEDPSGPSSQTYNYLSLGNSTYPGLLDINTNYVSAGLRIVNNGIMQAQLSYDNDGGTEFYLRNDTATSTLTPRNLILNQNLTTYQQGVFKVDVSGNVSASGTLATFGNTTLGDSDATGGDITRIYGSLAMGAAPTGNAQLFLSATSSNAVPLIIRANVNQAEGIYLTNWQDSSGSSLGYFASSTISDALSLHDEDGFTVASAYQSSYLKIGSLTRAGVVDLGYNGSFIVKDLNNNITAKLTSGSLQLGGETSTSTYSNNQIILGKASDAKRGIFFVNSSGNVSASGTISIDVTNSTPAKGLVIRSIGGGMAFPMLDLRNGDSTQIGYIATSTDYNGKDSVLLQLGNGVGTGERGLVVLKSAGPSNSGSFQVLDTNGNYGQSLLEMNLLTLGDGAVTSTFTGSALTIGTTTGNQQGEFYVDSSGNVSASGTFRVFGEATTGGLQISASNSTTTLTSYATDAAGVAAFVLNSNSTIASTTAGTALDRVLLAVQNAGTNKFLISGGGNVYATAGFNANSTQYGIGDVAEYVNLAVGESAEPGDVIVTDANSLNKFKKSTEAYAKNIAGVVSDSGAFVIGASGENRAALGMTGLIKTKATDENGPINAGDYLVASSKAGYAMKYDPDSGTPAGLVGMATESLASGEGKIIIMVNKGYVSGSVASKTPSLNVSTNDQGQLVQTGSLDMAGQSILNIASLSSKSGKWSIDEEGNLTTEKIKADEAQIKKLTIEKEKEVKKSTVGEATIKTGETKVVVENEVVSSTSKIFISFLNDPEFSWWISKKENGRFEVSLKHPATNDATFDYWLIDVAENSNSSENGMGVPAEQTPPAIETSAEPAAAPLSETSPSEETPDTSPTLETSSSSSVIIENTPPTPEPTPPPAPVENPTPETPPQP